MEISKHMFSLSNGVGHAEIYIFFLLGLILTACEYGLGVQYASLILLVQATKHNLSLAISKGLQGAAKSFEKVT